MTIVKNLVLVILHGYFFKYPPFRLNEIVQGSPNIGTCKLGDSY